MSRRRSQTIEADTYEDFIRISFEGSSAPRSSSLPSIPSQERNPFSQLEIVCNKENLEEKNLPSCWDDCSFEESPPYMIQDSSDLDSMFVNKKSKSEGFFYQGKGIEHDENAGMKVKQYKVMVVGAHNTGKHVFINSLFDKENKKDLKVPNALDLMIKKYKGKDQLNLFKFWIKDANSHCFDQLLKVHYRTIKIYVFMYKTTDRTTFNCLESAVEQAKTESTEKNFCGILIGNVRHPKSFLGSLLSQKKKKREVAFEEGEEFKKKHGLLQFFETSVDSNQMKQQILDCLLSMG